MTLAEPADSFFPPAELAVTPEEYALARKLFKDADLLRHAESEADRFFAVEPGPGLRAAAVADELCRMFLARGHQLLQRNEPGMNRTYLLFV